MSFVSVIGTENFLTVCSDGRAVNWQGEEFTVQKGHFKKFILPTPETFVAFGGRLPLINQFIRENGLDRLTVSDYGARVDDLQAQLRKPPYADSEGEVLICYGGRNLEGRLEFCALGTAEGGPHVFKPQGDAIEYSFLYQPKTMNAAGFDDAAMVAVFKSCLRATGFDTPPRMLEAQRRLNDYIADRNPVVDKRVRTAVIT